MGVLWRSIVIGCVVVAVGDICHPIVMACFVFYDRFGYQVRVVGGQWGSWGCCQWLVAAASNVVVPLV